MRLNAFCAIAFLLALVFVLPALPAQAAPLAPSHPQLSASFLFLGELTVFVPGLELEATWPLLGLYPSASLLYATSGRWGLTLGLSRFLSPALQLAAGLALQLDLLEGFLPQLLLKARWRFPLGRGSAWFFNELGVQVPLGKGFWQLRYGAGLTLILRF